MHIKIYATPLDANAKHSAEKLFLIDNAENVIVYQGNYQVPSDFNHPFPTDYVASLINDWQPSPDCPKELQAFESGAGYIVRFIDYTRNGICYRAMVNTLAYICNDNGKTIEKVEAYSGAKLSKE